MKHLKRIALTLLLVFGLSMSFAAIHTPAVSADAKSEICGGIGAASGGTTCTDAKGAPTIPGLVNTIINILSWIVGVLAVIMVIIAGFKYVTSNGDSGQVSSAKTTLIYAIVGVVIVALSQTIVKYVVQQVTK